jgi:hypothetical protein
MSLSLLSILAGPALERIAGPIAACAAHASLLSVALSWLAFLGIGAGFFAVFFVIGACVVSGRISEAERREAAESFDQLGPVIGSRPETPATPMSEYRPPSYPTYWTTANVMRPPSMVAHPASWLCDVEGPHPIGECGQVRATNPLVGESRADVRHWS